MSEDPTLTCGECKGYYRRKPVEEQMRRLTVITIIILLIFSFGALVFYGLRHSRGVPVKIEEIERSSIDVHFLDRDIDLSEGISLELWDKVSPSEVKLVYQVTALPWPVPRDKVSPVIVKAFHNRKDIFFYLSGQDESEDRVLETNRFSDACAIMFPMDEKAQPHSIMMGFLGRANIWQWKASQDREYYNRNQKPENRNQRPEVYSDFYYPFEEEETLVVSKDVPTSSANDLMAIRVGTITPKEIQNISGRGFWKDGIWRVVFKRSLRAVDLERDADFKPGKKLCAFAVWNGRMGDRGGRKTISDWAELEIK